MKNLFLILSLTTLCLSCNNEKCETYELLYRNTVRDLDGLQDLAIIEIGNLYEQRLAEIEEWSGTDSALFEIREGMSQVFINISESQGGIDPESFNLIGAEDSKRIADYVTRNEIKDLFIKYSRIINGLKNEASTENDRIVIRKIETLFLNFYTFLEAVEEGKVPFSAVYYSTLRFEGLFMTCHLQMIS